MKRPIISQQERSCMINPKLEVAKLKFKREIDRSRFGQMLYKIVQRLSKKLSH
ncbi:hypothetical protein CFS9_03090 [Flavobacterium sp. CFS9]|uniref:Uncharacterized protein n=1 Tax=Flavobacterium sp. CFS9 TaxID=3143118 RepID=A0AAT9GW42_9FLAO